MKKCAFYVRIPKYRPEYTIEFQEEKCKNYMNVISGREGYEHVKTFKDEGFAETDRETKRIAFFQCIRAAANGQFDVLCIYDIDCLGDTDAVILNSLRMIREAKIAICIPASNIYKDPTRMKNFSFPFECIVATFEYYVERKHIRRFIKNKTKAAENAAKIKEIEEKVIWGYIKNDSSSIEIVPEKRKIINKIYDNYFRDGYNSIRIALLLNKEGVLCEGKIWNSQIIDDILINHRNAYKGGEMYGKKWPVILDYDNIQETNELR